MRKLLSLLSITLISTSIFAQGVTLPARSPDGTPLAREDGPSNHAVLLQPPADVPVKGPNNDRERHGEFSAWGGFLYMQPTFTNNPAFVIARPLGDTRIIEFNERLDFGPDLWVAFTHERGWGVRARWFQFDHDANQSYTAAAAETIRAITSRPAGQTAVAGTVVAGSNLALTVADIQGTCHFNRGPWSHTLGLGVRYTHISQDYRVTLTSPAAHVNVVSGHNLNGVGPAATLETRRRLGETGLALYGALYGSIVFGHAQENNFASNGGAPQYVERSYTDALPVGEMEIGAEYRREVGRANVFVQAGFVGQLWWGAGNASNFDAIPFSSAGDTNLGFLGLVVRAGVRY